MWFKQCQAYRLPETPDAAVLAAALDEHRFVPPCGLDWFTDGFAVPQPFGDELVFAADKTLGISLKREERVLPGAVIKTALDGKIAKIEAEEARNVGRKERQELKEQIIDELLPRAFTRASRTDAVLVGGYLLINQTGNKAENLLGHLREALGGLRAQPTVTRRSVSELMTQWLLRGEADGQFELDDYVALVGAGDMGAEIRIKREDVTAEEVVQHVKCGKRVVELGLVWRESVVLVLTQDLTFKRIGYLDHLREDTQSQGDSSADVVAASQIIMAHALTSMLDELIIMLGGLQD
ncbi:recombination-associated protein RdgC [Eikenella sp. S3360]|uniref:Recombination-associated protein RdgC n=1 Tax=Eikenella glucosivorans TaxID=2766967 RepID=A0ABS0N9N6_9NEIS|nr:recombination-associated protein RdgC [Eikenella glucosivorans]MBH5328997.1 recombination-associated protein RdgC [Eikenella glucosivorans]